MREKNPLFEGNLGSAIFFPRTDMPYGDEAPGARDHMFDVEAGVRLRLRLFMGEVDWPVILFFHGNGETARDYDPVSRVYNNLELSFAVAEYRGYGPSTGTPSLETLLEDAKRTLDELMAILEPSSARRPIIVMGRSLGSAPAIELAASRFEDLSGLIVESGFAFMVPLLELLGVPAKDLGIEERHGPENLKKMSGITLPTLVMHAEDDQIIPIGDGEALNDASADPSKTFLSVPMAGHNDIQLVAGKLYFEHVAALVERTLQASG